MFRLFSKKDPTAALQKKYRALLQKSFELSKTNRAESDKVMAEAEEIAKEIEALKG